MQNVFIFTHFFPSSPQGSENLALRLKDSAVTAQQGQAISKAAAGAGAAGGGSSSVGLRPSMFLDEEAYIAAATLAPGADAYTRNKFNQAESDKLASNRDVPDTRHFTWVPESEYARINILTGIYVARTDILLSQK